MVGRRHVHHRDAHGVDAGELQQRQGDAVVGDGAVDAGEMVVFAAEIHRHRAAGDGTAAQGSAVRHGAGEARRLARSQQLFHDVLSLLLAAQLIAADLLPVHLHAGDGVAAAGAAAFGAELRRIVKTQLAGRVGAAAGGETQQQRRGQQRRQEMSHPSHASSSRCASGRRTVNVVPTPSAPWPAEMAPPRPSMVSFTMDSPRPVPPTSLERILSTR